MFEFRGWPMTSRRNERGSQKDQKSFPALWCLLRGKTCIYFHAMRDRRACVRARARMRVRACARLLRVRTCLYFREMRHRRACARVRARMLARTCTRMWKPHSSSPAAVLVRCAASVSLTAMSYLCSVTKSMLFQDPWFCR